MKAMILTQFGGIENFALRDIPNPVPAKGEVLIEVKAIGIDQIDIKTRAGGGMKGIVSKQDPMILGWDASGVITKLGEGVEQFKVGDEVFGTINFPGPGSTYAQMTAAPADQLARKPASITHAEAAAATQSPLTAWQSLVEAGNIKKGQKVLIHGGAGGVGNYAVQIAKYIGCHVITTAAGSDADFVKGLGADQVIDYKTQRFEELVSDVDFILDTIGGENFIRSLKVLKPGGTIVLLPSDKDGQASKAASENGVKNYVQLSMHSSGEDMRQIAKMLERGELKAHVDKVFTFEQLPQAQQQLENGKVKGKVVAVIE